MQDKKIYFGEIKLGFTVMRQKTDYIKLQSKFVLVNYTNLFILHYWNK